MTSNGIKTGRLPLNRSEKARSAPLWIVYLTISLQTFAHATTVTSRLIIHSYLIHSLIVKNLS
jgi:hypothetical protein